MGKDDDVPTAEIGKELIVCTVRWIRKAELEIEALAAETGKPQERTVALRDGKHTLLQVHLTCEPRQFAKKTLDGPWAPFVRWKV